MLALVDFGALFNFMNSLVAKCLSWAINPNNTQVSMKSANRTVVHSLGTNNGFVLSGVWQVYVILLVLDAPFEVILGIS